LLAVRDRHNGNILIDEQGRVVHIDFGFFLSNSPGGNANFERAPFKLTREMIDVMGGEHSLEFATFRDLVIRGFRASHRVYPKVRMLVQVALEAYGAQFPCFSGGADAVLEGLDRRFRTDLKSKREAAQFVNEELINPSIDNWRTRWYDKYQMCCLGIL
jgi:phosphatidylinositol 4-kinase